MYLFENIFWNIIHWIRYQFLNIYLKITIVWFDRILSKFHYKTWCSKKKVKSFCLSSSQPIDSDWVKSGLSVPKRFLFREMRVKSFIVFTQKLLHCRRVGDFVEDRKPPKLIWFYFESKKDSYWFSLTKFRRS